MISSVYFWRLLDSTLFPIFLYEGTEGSIWSTAFSSRQFLSFRSVAMKPWGLYCVTYYCSILWMVQVTNGCQLKPSATAQAPEIQLSDKSGDNNYYTLVMTDPDAPSPSEPSLREWLHWIVTDIPGNSGGSETNTGFSWLSEQATSTSSSGRELVPYIGPRPPIGIHRYIFVLFKQPSQSFLISPPAARNNFSTRNFAAYYGLGLPVAATYCNSQKEPASRSR
ncbi:protein MOTHER of FT and TFL1 isoform X1 [Physcomitrium patens]|uniref:Mother of FT and TFL1-like protein n=1 Tax=Physcomitrium patens TaxID=3218 RepID=A0A7I4AN35_PHYPA|nr:protein MOTHER of FT and TFL1-like isoform X1 [Physcomitrium patens]XP_024395461.1 protein MOTHER of FT and TFL1-like isoform X1 [Physcomitrium patens]|eukprot:XP_024395460.1 protein MOTHER of FT and TFL1-like isoform X1 [Physcomitrella patens]